MSGETSPSNNQDSESTGWAELNEHQSPISDEWKSLITDGIYDIDKKPTEDYLNSAAGQKAVATVEKFNQDTAQIDRLKANLEEQVAAGAISEEQAQKYREKYSAKQEEALDKAISQIDDYRQDYVDSQVVGTPEEDWIDDSRIYSREEVLAQKANETQPNAETTAETTPQPDTQTSPEITVKIELEDQLASDVEDAKRLENLQNLVEAEQEAESLADLQTTVEGLDTAESQQDTTEQTPGLDHERLEALEKQLDQQRTNLAELFVKKGRILGPKHREEYDQAKQEYETLRDEYLRLKSESSQDETAPLENYLEEDRKLLEEVNDRVDNGNLYRKITGIFGNKYYKQAMLAHGVRSLGVTSAEEVGSAQASNQVPTQAPPTAPPAAAPETSQPNSGQDSLRDFQTELSHTEVGTLVGPAGIDLMSIPNPESNTDRPDVIYRIADWWNHLPDVAKNAVRTYEATQANSPYGGHLRLWLEQFDQATSASTPESAT